MAVFVRAIGGYRSNISRHMFASFIGLRNAKHLCQEITLSHRLLRPCSSHLANGQVFVKVPTSEDPKLHHKISGSIIGKGGRNIDKLLLPSLHCKAIPKDDHIAIYGFDNEMVKTVEEIVTILVRRYIRDQFDCTATVSTDDDIDVHAWICFQVKQRFQTEHNFGIDRTKRSQLIVSALDDDVMKYAVEKINQEIQRIKNDIALPVREMVQTDEDPAIHYMICSIFAKDRYMRVKELMSETGLDFRLFTKKPDCIMVSGKDIEVVNIAVKRVALEIQKIRKELHQYPFIKRVSTDRDYDVHVNICERLFSGGLQEIRRFEFENGPDLKVQTSKEGYLFVSGSDTEVVQKAAALLDMNVKRIKHTLTYFPIEEKVWTHDDIDMHHYISRQFMKEGREAMRKFILETGLDFEIDERTHSYTYNCSMTGYILVKGYDAEVVMRAARKVTEEMERVKKEVCLPFMKKVPLDVTAHISKEIYGFLFGKQDERKALLESELNCKLSVTRSCRHILVCTSDNETMKTAEEAITKEIRKIKRFKIKPCQEGLLTDEDPYIHQAILAKLLANNQEAIERIKMKAKIDFDLGLNDNGRILIFGSHAPVVRKARHHIQKEVRRLKKLLNKAYND